jgi:hypothetical protein
MLATTLRHLEASTRNRTLSSLASRLVQTLGLDALYRPQLATVWACEETGEEGSCYSGPGNQAPPPASPPRDTQGSQQQPEASSRSTVLDQAVAYLTFRTETGNPNDEVSPDLCEETGEDGSCHTGPGNQAPPPSVGPGEEPTPQSSGGSGTGSSSTLRQLLSLRPALVTV